MSPADGSRPILASVTKDAQAFQFTTSLVPSKRKADDESFYSSSEEGIDGYERTDNECCQYFRFTEDDLDQAYTKVLEEEEAIRVVAARAFVKEHVDIECRQYFRFTQEDLDQAYTKVLEEEQAIRVEAELGLGHHDALRVERECDEDGELLPEFYDGYDDTRYEIYADDALPIETKDDVLFESRIRSDLEDISNPEFQKELCGRCRTVRWSALTRMSLSKRRVVYKMQGSPLKLRGSHCKLCRLLGRIGSNRMSPADSGDGTLEFDLSICRSREEGTKVLVLSLNGESERSLITLHSTTDNKEWNPRINDPEIIDYGTLKRVFAQCCRAHATSCRPQPRVQLSGFKVIDCFSRKIVLAPEDCRYVALSYVWGQTPDNDNKAQKFSGILLPVTVEDSLRVTKKMGFRYLWIDRYCINQKNKVEKHEFIQNMDEIYSKAQLTIIAAAGKNPHYGLPGVGSRPRYLERHVRIEDTKLVQLMRPGSDLEKSSWWERAWTYQEGVLSKRKLVFTDHQVFYVCNKMHSAESLDMHTANSVHADINAFFYPISFGEMMLPIGPRSYVSYLRDISRRALSHPSDALNTCLGILKATNTTHLWGIPIETDSASGKHTIALCWRHNVTMNRRCNFPSWSWAGWEGGVNLQDSIAASPFVTIRLGDYHQSWQTVYEYISSGRAENLAGKSTAPRLLKITGSALDAALLNEQWPDITDFGTGAAVQQDDRPRPHFSLSFDGTYVLAILYMDQEMGTAEQLHDVIAMGVQSDNEDCCITALLLKPRGDVYTRVGMIKLTCEYLSCKRPFGSHVFWEQGAQMRTVIVE